MSEIISKIKRNIDKGGRFVVPSEFREGMGLKKGDRIEVAITSDGSLIISKARELDGYEREIGQDLQILWGLIKRRVLVCTLSDVIAEGADTAAPSYVGMKISKTLTNMIKQIGDYQYDGGELFYPFSGVPIPALIVKSICYENEGVGAIMVMADSEAPGRMEGNTAVLLEYAAKMIQKYL